MPLIPSSVLEAVEEDEEFWITTQERMGRIAADRKHYIKPDGKPQRPTMRKLTITAPDVEYKDFGMTQYPEAGEEILVQRESVARSLVSSGLARDGWGDEKPADPTTVKSESADAEEADTGLDTQVSEVADEDIEPVAWSDVTGISQASTDLLAENAPDEDARALYDLIQSGDEDARSRLVQWLAGSSRRATLVVNALEEHFTASAGTEDAR